MRSRLSLQALLHLSGVVQCTIIAAVIGVVVGVLVYRSSIGSAAATALASTVLTVPSFALLGLLTTRRSATPTCSRTAWSGCPTHR